MARLWDAYFNAPEHKEEGATKRTNFSLTGPLGDEFSFRLYGNLDKTRADAWDINQWPSVRACRNVCHDVTSRARRGDQQRY